MTRMNGEKCIDAIIGTQHGDEGKGGVTYKLVSEGYSAVARFNGGANAGHTFEHDGREINTHQVPSGITNPNVLNLITLSSLVDPIALRTEIDDLEDKNISVNPENLVVDKGANLVLPHHIVLDAIRESGSGGQGSTKRGIAPTAADKYGRKGVTPVEFLHNRAGVERLVTESLHELRDTPHELGEDFAKILKNPEQSWRNWEEQLHSLVGFFGNTTNIVHEILSDNQRILAEGAQGTGLDIEHGARPEVTSSHTTIGGVLNSLGVGAHTIDQVYGVAKLTPSRVGGTLESFPTVIRDEALAAKIRGNKGEIDAEWGKATGREREVGYLDLSQIRQAIRVSGITRLILTKLDCVPRSGDTTQISTHYLDRDGEKVLHTPNSLHELSGLTPAYSHFSTWGDISSVKSFQDLPKTAKDYVSFIEAQLDVEASLIGVGPTVDQIIDRR